MGIQDLNFDDLIPKAPPKNGALSFDDLVPKKPEAFMRGPAGVAEDMNPLQAMLVGAGRGLSQVGAGAQQVYNWATGDTGAQAQLGAQQKEADRIYKPMQEAHPLASGVGEYLPAFAMPVGGAASVLGAAGRMALPGMTQAALSYGSPEERAKEVALQGLGGSVGGAATSAIGKAISPAIGAAARAVTPELDRLAQVAKDMGMRLTPAQSGGGKFAQGVESALDTIPFTTGGQQAVKEAQQIAFNRKVLSSVGAQADKATPDVLGDAARTVGAKFDAATAGITVPLPPSTMAMVDAVEKNYLRRLPDEVRVKVANIAEDLRAAGPAITGEQYKAFAEDIASAARQTTDGKTERALYGLRSVLDAAYKSAAPADKAALYFEARGQWKNLLTITDAMEKARSVSGDIPAKQFYAAMQRFNANMPRGSGGELGDVARAGRQFLTDPINNSGTPFRNAFTNLLTAGTMGGLGAGGSALSGGDPLQGAALGLAGFGLSKGAQKLYNSSYMTNQLLPEELKQLLIRGGGLLGTGAAARSQ